MNAPNDGQHARARRLIRVLTFCVGASALGACQREIEVTMFENVSAGSNLEFYQGMTHGAAWGDFNNDGLPDLYVTNHLNAPQLFQNLGAGKFSDVTTKWFTADALRGDKHGAQWADFDNNGRLDLVQLTGAQRGVGAEPKHLFKNLGDHFEDVALTMGVDNPEGRTRMPLWLDLNVDGRLDLFEGAEARFDGKKPPFFFVSTDNDSPLAPADEILPIDGRAAPFCILTELTGDRAPELVCRLMGKNRAVQVFDTAVHPAKDVDLLPQTAFEDIASGDFDNDGRLDLVMARKNPPGAVALGQIAPTAFIADVQLEKGHPEQNIGISFGCQGNIHVAVSPVMPADGLRPDRVFLGTLGGHPGALEFDLDIDSQELLGQMPSPPSDPEATSLVIAQNAPGQWEIKLISPTGSSPTSTLKTVQIQFHVSSSAAITALSALANSGQPEAAPIRLFMNTGNGLVEQSDKRGLNVNVTPSTSVVAGDFDNDMDLDVFLLGSGDVALQGNRLFFNDGTGTFSPVVAAGGIPGGGAGVGDVVTTADFDRDGDLDLMIATGASMGRSLGMPANGGRYQLYRNITQRAHWLELDLEGASSNRDGIGAMVRLTAGGKTQLRMQDGGAHHRGQNHNRLHFGLGQHALAESIEIEWPSGIKQKLDNVNADQIFHIREPNHAPNSEI